MDKLRAIEYFLRAAEAGSFGRAARALDVSTPALTQLVMVPELLRSPSALLSAAMQSLTTFPPSNRNPRAPLT